MSDEIIEKQTSGVMRANKAAYREMIKHFLARHAMAFIYLPVLLAPTVVFPTRSKSSKESLHLDPSSRSFASPQQYIHHIYVQ